MERFVAWFHFQRRTRNRRRNFNQLWRDTKKAATAAASASNCAPNNIANSCSSTQADKLEQQDAFVDAFFSKLDVILSTQLISLEELIYQLDDRLMATHHLAAKRRRNRQLLVTAIRRLLAAHTDDFALLLMCLMTLAAVTQHTGPELFRSKLCVWYHISERLFMHWPNFTDIMRSWFYDAM